MSSQRDEIPPFQVTLEANSFHVTGTKFAVGDLVYYPVRSPACGRIQWGMGSIFKNHGNGRYALETWQWGMRSILEDHGKRGEGQIYKPSALADVEAKSLCRAWDGEFPTCPISSLHHGRDETYSLEQARKDFGPHLQFAGAKQADLGPEFWGITFEQLVSVTRLTGYRAGMSMYDVVNNLIKPLTAGTGTGYALYLNRSSPLRAKIMVSHAWQESYSQFLEALRRSELAGPFWVCAMAIYQCEDLPSVSIAAQLGTDVNRGPFATVLKQSHMMIAVITEAANICERMWCVLEIFVAVQVGTPVRLTATREMSGFFGSDQILNDAAIKYGKARCHSEAARCGNPSQPMNDDERSIRALIESTEGGYDAIDSAVEWVKAMYLASDPPRYYPHTIAFPAHPFLLGGYTAVEMRVQHRSAVANAISRIHSSAKCAEVTEQATEGSGASQHDSAVANATSRIHSSAKWLASLFWCC